ncbi:MAG TPA: hypothetical protein VKE51_12500 [Vicinamibacterales bacterium]|nr:hypothetical protein [Vicinamibacterales bacterium]
MPDAPESFLDAADEEFAAPDRAVVSVAGAVERDAEGAPREGPAFGQHAGHVRAMMLDRNDAPAADRGGVFGRGVTDIRSCRTAPPLASPLP